MAYDVAVGQTAAVAAACTGSRAGRAATGWRQLPADLAWPVVRVVAFGSRRDPRLVALSPGDHGRQPSLDHDVLGDHGRRPAISGLLHEGLRLRAADWHVGCQFRPGHADSHCLGAHGDGPSDAAEMAVICATTDPLALLVRLPGDCCCSAERRHAALNDSW